MPRSGVYRLLEIPFVYALAQRILDVGSTALPILYQEVYGSTSGLVLDVGCGPTLGTPAVAGTMVGVDVNRDYVRSYVSSGRPDPSCRRLGVVGAAEALPFRDGAFDECRSAFMLHHLPDAAARRALEELRRTARPGGRVAVFDMVRPRSFFANPAAWLVTRFDRGEWVRPHQELVRLADASGAAGWDTRSFSYSWIGLRGVLLVHRRNGDLVA